jgi:hypothetical protein
MFARPQIAVLALGLLLAAGRAVAAPAPLELVTADATGATLRFTLPKPTVSRVTRPEGTFWRLEVPGLTGSVAEEGRPLLPAQSALLGMPAGTIASVRVLEETSADLAELDGKEIEPVGKNEFRPDGKGLSPTRTFYRDPAFYEGGRPWPSATAELGASGGWRHQRVVSVRIQPFRVDPVTKRVRAVTSATIRVDFVPAGAARTGPAPLDGERPAVPATDAWEGLYRRGLLNYEAAKAFRTVVPKSVRRLGGGAFETQGTRGIVYDPASEWSLEVDTTGVWRVTYAQLAAAGFPAGVPTAQLALTRRTYAPGQSPPFVRVPVPLRVLEGATGVAGTFDGTDAIAFYGQSWTERERPSEYRRRFGDADVFYVGVDPAAGGARMPELSADLGFATPVPPASFPSYRKYEKRHYFNYTPSDTCTGYEGWTDPFLDFAFTDSLTMWTPDVDASGTVRFKSTWLGATFNPFQHTIWVRWKRPGDNLLTPVATASWGGKELFVSDTTFAADRIAAGTNRLDWRGWAVDASDPNGRGSGATLRSYEVTYARFYRAFGNALDLNSGGAEGQVEIEVDRFSAPSAPTVTFYDVTDSTAPRALLVPAAFVRSTGPSLWAARFQDTVDAGTRRRYFALIDPPTLPNQAVTATPRAYATPIWDAPGSPDLVVVTPEPFRAEAERLAAHRRTQGFEVLVAPEQEVYDAFDGGRRSDWAIRRLLEYAFANWDSRFVCLVGDASDDPRGEIGTADKDWMPSHLISGPVGTSTGQELSMSDFWYVNDLDNTTPPGPACTNSEPDPFPDMSIGRLPAGSAAQMKGMVDKAILYDTTDRTASWRNKVVLLPDDPYSFASFTGDPTANYCYRFEEEVFERLSDVLEGVIKVEGGFRDMNVEQFRLREKLLPLGRPVPGDPSICQPLDVLPGVRAYTRDFTGPQLRTDLGDGALVLNYQGHGSAVLLAHEAIWTVGSGAQDVDLVFNEGKPYFFLSFSCHVNQFSSIKEGPFGDALGEGMVLGPQNPPRPTAGAIASYASTNYELLPPDRTGQNHLNVWIFRALFVDPPHDQFLGQSGARVLLGEALTLGAVHSSANTFGLERRAIQTYTLLGDPSTPLETGAPRMFATANGLPVVSGARFQPGAPGDSVALVIDLVDESRIDDLTLTITGEGARAVDPSEYVITPTYPDTLNGGAGRRYLLTWNARPEPKDADLVISAKDRNELATSFVLSLRLEARLFANGQPIGDGDIAPSSGDYQLVVSSPARLTAEDFTFTVDGVVPGGLVITPAPSDSSRRLWTLNWTGDYDTGSHDAVVTFPGGATRRISFLTSSEARVALRRVYAFPTPFAAPPVTINFTLDADQPTTVALKVYSVAGSLVYQRIEPGVSPGYHQWLWDARDDRADAIGNGTYLYTLVAEDGRGLKAVERGKLARLR